MPFRQGFGINLYPVSGLKYLDDFLHMRTR